LRRSRRLLAFLALVLSLSGCGYGLVGRTSSLPPEIRSLYVEPLENRTTRQQVELLLTEALVGELVTRRRFEIVRRRDLADAILGGEITSFIVRPVRFDADGRAEEYEIAIRANMQFTATKDGEKIWARDQYVFRENYEFVEEFGDGEFLFNVEDITIQEVARNFAQTLVIDVLEGF